MTMLEALAALVILGASAAGFLGVFQSGARSLRLASEWNRATTVAEAALEQAVRERVSGTTSPETPVATEGFEARVQSAPWSMNVEDVAVRVRLPDGRVLTVHRLVRHR